MNNDSITIMQKVEELKQWQKQYEARQGKDCEENNILNIASPSMQRKSRGDLTMKSDILDLDSGIHMIDELLNRIQSKSAEPQAEDKPDAATFPSPPHQRPSFASSDVPPGQEPQDDPSQTKPRRPFLKRGEGLSRYRMSLSDFKKPVPKPSFALSRVRRKQAFQPVAVSNKRPSQSEAFNRPSQSEAFNRPSQSEAFNRPSQSEAFNRPSQSEAFNRPSQSEAFKRPNRVLSKPDLMSKAALTHLETWSNLFGSDQGPKSKVPTLDGFPNDQGVTSNLFSSNKGSTWNAQPVNLSPLTQHRTQMSMELDRRKKKETEEQKVFELLEQKARDSSFNSTSSMVAKLMEDSVMSTPVKNNTARTRDPCVNSSQENGRPDKGSHVRFVESNPVETIEEVDESRMEDKSTGFTIEQLPVHTQTDTEEECACESDTHYSSSDEEAAAEIPSVEEALKNYKTVLNRPCLDSGKPGTPTYSQLEEYLKLSQPLRPLPPNSQAKAPGARGVQTNNNAVVKETKQILAEVKKLQEEREQLESEVDNKENERGRGNRQARRGPSFPMTVYQETYQKPTSRGVASKRTGAGPVPAPSGGLKSFGSEDPEPNPFEHKSESSLNVELLKKRLGDLENEIHVFRLENVRLNKERKELEKDKAAFTRAKKASETSLREEKEAFTREMEEERSKLNREKKVFLKYAKDAKNFPSKQEREELTSLKTELQRLKEEAVKKETKWAASQARLRNHVKVLETQNTELKVQVEKLSKEAKKVSFASKKHISNTQIMNAINSQISKLTKSDVLPAPPTSTLKKPSLPAGPGAPQALSAPSSYNLSAAPPDKEIPMPEDSLDRAIYQSLYSTGEKRTSAGSEETPSHDDDVIPIESLNLASPRSTDSEYKEIVTSDGTREKHYKDGRQEIHYPNGNTMIVSEAGKYIKMFYYNGDIKETDTGDRTVRYFYSETNTWHTTQADGTETLEFANGQRETRLKDGRVEIEYTNGCRRTIGKDGTEKWRFDEGPVETVEVLSDGQRILKLRNGQKEIHTREYKRREFPDGAVKLVYPDGIQETRYPNGRIRLKDGDGNLIMDSHEM